MLLEGHFKCIISLHMPFSVFNSISNDAMYLTLSFPVEYPLKSSDDMYLTLSSPVAERPQHMLMRVAVGVHGEQIEKAIEVSNCVCVCSIYYTIQGPITSRLFELGP